jgi:hypothetical protein
MRRDRSEVLDRDTITVASRLMIPAYVVFFAGLGLNFVITPLHRLGATPGLQYVQISAGGIRLYGVTFLVVAALIAAAMASRRRGPCLYALNLGALSMALWGVLQLAAAIFSTGSPSGWCWPGIVCAACMATSRSLRRREV